MPVDRTSLIGFLKDELAVDVDDVEEDTPLFSSGILDSFAIVSLMTWLENDAGIQVLPSDVNLANFDSLSRILRYVQSVRAEATAEEGR
jgi:acyl carrier protein